MIHLGISTSGVWAKAHTAFGQQVQAGKEPPLVSTAKTPASQPMDGVVTIRLAGKDSDVTLKEWLDRCHADIEKSSPQSKQSKRQRNKPRRFVLETPRSKTRMRVPVDQGTGYLRRQSHIQSKVTSLLCRQRFLVLGFETSLSVGCNSSGRTNEEPENTSCSRDQGGSVASDVDQWSTQDFDSCCFCSFRIQVGSRRV